jgi:hypothetical protein
MSRKLNEILKTTIPCIDDASQVLALHETILAVNGSEGLKAYEPIGGGLKMVKGDDYEEGIALAGPILSGAPMLHGNRKPGCTRLWARLFESHGVGLIGRPSRGNAIGDATRTAMSMAWLAHLCLDHCTTD